MLPDDRIGYRPSRTLSARRSKRIPSLRAGLFFRIEQDQLPLPPIPLDAVLELALLRLDPEPGLGVFLGGQLAVMLEDDGRRVPRFQRHLLRALHLRDPVADEGMAQHVVRPLAD